MPNCPQCNREFLDLPRICPSCKADLDLLVEYVGELETGLNEAYQFTRGGELGKAIWVYLSVLEMDPDNPTARRQVGQVATAVRQFDRTAPGRRWFAQLRGEDAAEVSQRAWLRWVFVGLAALLLVLIGFGIGFLVGIGGIDIDSALPDTPIQKNDTMMGG